jgi:hypothetical protein
MAAGPGEPRRDDLRAVLDALAPFGTVLALKLYRLTLAASGAPSLPCLDHEAGLHANVAPHVSVYLQQRTSGDLHEVAFTPSRRRIDIDTASTIGEYSPEAHTRLRAMLAERFPDYGIHEHGPSWWRGERRVAEACRAQITLREVLLGDDLPRIERRIGRLQLISALMEKQSRVASWGVRTVTAPVLAAAGFLAYQLLGAFGTRLGETAVTQLRYVLVTAVGGAFLYYGLKAVQLTEMANRVWKRAAEYNLILSGRRRLAANAQPRPEPAGRAYPTP